jgi:hypothetical protein
MALESPEFAHIRVLLCIRTVTAVVPLNIQSILVPYSNFSYAILNASLTYVSLIV